jgi:hypothetical protein
MNIFGHDDAVNKSLCARLPNYAVIKDEHTRDEHMVTSYPG